jgi:hypothetical protein
VQRERLVQQEQIAQFLDQQDRLVLLALLERLVLRVQQEQHQLFQDLLVQLEQLEIQDRLVQLVLMVRLDQLVRQEQAVQLVQLDLPVQQVRQALVQMLSQ